MINDLCAISVGICLRTAYLPEQIDIYMYKYVYVNLIIFNSRAIKDFEGQYAIVSPMLNGDSADQLAINALLDTIITWLLGNTQ